MTRRFDPGRGDFAVLVGRSELKPFSPWNDGRPEPELHFKFYRHATNKIAGLSAEADAFLRGFF